MQNDIKAKVLSLSATNFIVVLVNAILFPVFPQIKEALNIGLRELSLLHVFVSLPAAIFNPLGGILADRWGRKKVIIPSLVLYGAGGVVAGSAVFIAEDAFSIMLLGRFMQGIGAATPMFLTVALAGDIFQSSERTKAIGFLETANGLGKLSGPIIGGFIGLIGWYAPFFAYAVFTIPVALAVWKFIEEPAPQPKALKEELYALKKLRNISNILALFTAFLVIFTLIGTMFWLGNMLEGRIAGGKVLRGFIISLPVMALMATAMLFPWINKKSGLRLMMGSGLFCLSSAMIGIAFLSETHLFWFFILLIGIGSGLLLPSIDTISTVISAKEHRGIFATIYGSTRYLGSAVAPYTFTVLLNYNLLITFLPIAAVNMVTGIIVLFFLSD